MRENSITVSLCFFRRPKQGLGKVHIRCSVYLHRRFVPRSVVPTQQRYPRPARLPHPAAVGKSWRGLFKYPLSVHTPPHPPAPRSLVHISCSYFAQHPRVPKCSPQTPKRLTLTLSHLKFNFISEGIKLHFGWQNWFQLRPIARRRARLPKPGIGVEIQYK